MGVAEASAEFLGVIEPDELGVFFLRNLLGGPD